MITSQTARGAELPYPGRPLPGFTLPETGGGTFRLGSLKQRRPVLLAFVHGSECAACRTWLAGLARERAALADLDAAVLIVAPEPVAQLRQLQAQVDLPFTLLADEAGSVAAAYVPHAGHLALYAADRYLQCLAGWHAPEATGLPPLEAPLTALLAAEQEDCGCGLPAWPEE